MLISFIDQLYRYFVFIPESELLSVEYEFEKTRMKKSGEAYRNASGKNSW